MVVTVGLNGPRPTLVCAAMLQMYETNGSRYSKRKDLIEEATICVMFLPSSDVMLMVYIVIIPFLCCTAGGSQLIDSDEEVSAMTTKF